MATFGRTEFDIPEDTPILNIPNDRTITSPTLDDVEPITAPETAPYEEPEPYTPSGDALVENRLTGLLDSGSKYIKAARQRGIETAHSRGLLNSSIAAGAAERAAIESAFPIASQDAGATHEAGIRGYEGKIEAGLQDLKYGHDVGVIEAQTRGSERIENIQQAGANYRLQMELDTKEKLDRLSLSSAEKENATRLIAEIGDTYSEQLRIINQDPGLTASAKTEIIEQLRAQYEQNAKIINDIYEVGIEWLDIKTDVNTPPTEEEKEEEQKEKEEEDKTSLEQQKKDLQKQIDDLQKKYDNMSEKSRDNQGGSIKWKIAALKAQLAELS